MTANGTKCMSTCTAFDGAFSASASANVVSVLGIALAVSFVFVSRIIGVIILSLVLILLRCKNSSRKTISRY